jgi:alpha-1,3-glucan synthase
MADLLAFSGYENASAPFSWGEYDYIWKSDRRYLDFEPGSVINESCEYPRFWDDDGYPLTSILADENGCRISEFDHYGDVPNTGSYPIYQNQLGKFGSVQDRLREWQPSVLAKINHFSCMQIAMLDIDGFRMDKGLETTVDALAEFSRYQRVCALRYNKKNFFVIGEVVGSDAQSAIYIGRGKQPDQYLASISDGMAATNTTNSTEYVREFGLTALDAPAFNYIVYAAITRLLG